MSAAAAAALFCIHFALMFSSIFFVCERKKILVLLLGTRTGFVRDDVTFNRWSGIILNAKNTTDEHDESEVAQRERSRDTRDEGRQTKERETFGQMKSKFYVLRLTFEAISAFTCPQLEQLSDVCASVSRRGSRMQKGCFQKANK